VHEDLVRAIDRVLAGQLFVPSLKALALVADGHAGHAARFYADDLDFVDGVSGFVDIVLRRGDVVCFVAREHIRRGVAKQLQARGWSVDASGEHGRYRAADSEEALSSIVSGGRLDTGRLARMVEDLEGVRVANAVGPSPRLTVVGEIAVPLFQNGDLDVGLEVERRWDALTHTLPFLTLCCYPTTCFDEQPGALFPDVCAEHWAVV